MSWLNLEEWAESIRNFLASLRSRIFSRWFKMARNYETIRFSYYSQSFRRLLTPSIRLKCYSSSMIETFKDIFIRYQWYRSEVLKSNILSPYWSILICPQDYRLNWKNFEHFLIFLSWSYLVSSNFLRAL